MSGDVSELFQFAADLGKASIRAAKEADRALEKGAHNIKEALAAQAKGSRNKGFRKMGKAISYDNPADLTYEIGPDKDRRGGALGNIFFFGTSKGGGSGDLGAALDAEIPALEEHVGKMVEDLL